MYTLTLFAHSYLRWAVVILGLTVIIRSFKGWRTQSAWTRLDEKLQVALVAVTDTQLLLGLLLYVFLSPLSRAFLAAPGAAMHDALFRFFGMEHVFMMVIAIAVLHIGRVRSKRAPTTGQRHRTVFTTTLFALVCIAAAIPWPFLAYGRPLLRTGS